MAREEFAALLQGYSLTTAEILYRLPDHPALLQTYIWQDYDLHPRFPRLQCFLDFWNRNLDGKLFKVLVAHKKLISPSELRIVDGEFRVH
ncbi:MAG: usg protein [Hyphomicrobiaceae bacterium]|nr:usg protein [Hyphomicrobiaceae bacterium]